MNLAQVVFCSYQHTYRVNVFFRTTFLHELERRRRTARTRRPCRSLFRGVLLQRRIDCHFPFHRTELQEGRRLINPRPPYGNCVFPDIHSGMPPIFTPFLRASWSSAMYRYTRVYLFHSRLVRSLIELGSQPFGTYSSLKLSQLL